MNSIDITHGKVQLPVAAVSADRSGRRRNVSAGQFRKLRDKCFTGSTFCGVTAIQHNIAVIRNVITQFCKCIRIRCQIFRIDHDPVQRKITGGTVADDMDGIIFPVALLFHPRKDLFHGILPDFQLQHIGPFGKFGDCLISSVNAAADHDQLVALAICADRDIQLIHRKHIGKAQVFGAVILSGDRKFVHILFVISTYAVRFITIHTVGNGQIGVCRSVNNISCVGRRSGADAVFIGIRSGFFRIVTRYFRTARFTRLTGVSRIFGRPGHHPCHSAFHQRLLRRIHIRSGVTRFRRSLFRRSKLRIVYQITGLVISSIDLRLLLLNVLYVLCRIHCFLRSTGFKQNSVFKLENTHVVAPVVLFLTPDRLCQAVPDSVFYLFFSSGHSLPIPHYNIYYIYSNEKVNSKLS